MLEKCRSLTADERTRVGVPSGWSPLGLVLHLAAMERRWVGLHLLQEYARHAGQLDVAVEIAGGNVGE